MPHRVSSLLRPDCLFVLWAIVAPGNWGGDVRCLLVMVVTAVDMKGWRKQEPDCLRDMQSAVTAACGMKARENIDVEDSEVF